MINVIIPKQYPSTVFSFLIYRHLFLRIDCLELLIQKKKIHRIVQFSITEILMEKMFITVRHQITWKWDRNLKEKRV